MNDAHAMLLIWAACIALAQVLCRSYEQRHPIPLTCNNWFGAVVYGTVLMWWVVMAFGLFTVSIGRWL